MKVIVYLRDRTNEHTEFNFKENQKLNFYVDDGGYLMIVKNTDNNNLITVDKIAIYNNWIGVEKVD